MLALAELSAERGYAGASAAAIAARAGLRESVFDALFDSVEDCLLSAYDAAVDQAFAAACEAADEAPGGWPAATRAALAALLDFAAGTPSFARLWVIEAPRLGDRAYARRQRAARIFTTLLDAGYDEPGAGDVNQLTPELITGGVFDVIHRHTVERRLDRLPAALPTVTVLALAPFVGRDEAIRLASV